MKPNKPTMLDRLIPDSGKIHQNQEVWDIRGACLTLKGTDYTNPPWILVRSEDRGTSDKRLKRA